MAHDTMKKAFKLLIRDGIYESTKKKDLEKKIKELNKLIQTNEKMFDEMS